MKSKDLIYTPNAFIFGISYESDISFASRIHNTKVRREFIKTVMKAWGYEI